jgi:dephospho-CoA kinase
MHKAPGMHIGLTGGIGSGKSTVARMLVGCGATLVDTDAIARQLAEPGGAAIPPLARSVW